MGIKYWPIYIANYLAKYGNKLLGFNAGAKNIMPLKYDKFFKQVKYPTKPPIE